MNRRSLLKSGLTALAGAALRCPPRAAFAAEALSVTPVADGIVVIAGAGGNVVAKATAQGHVLVDSGAEAAGNALLAALGGLPGGERVGTLFNTHWHREQVGSNAALGRAGATIVAHEKTRQRLAVGYYVPAEDRYEKPLPPEALPTETFYTRGETVAGGERIEHGYLLEAHTDGDIYVFFRDANVMAVGGAVSPVRDPELDWFGGGWIGGRVDALAMLLEISDAETRFVPSYGPVIGRAEVQAEHDLMLTLFERTVELLRKGYSAEDMLAAGVMDGLGRQFDDPLAFLDAAHRSLWAHHNTLSHDIV
ncbi:MAG TPA: MBL fold metallo-hydrolase [Gammaproteobacteria bacterium]